jgi:hypothetical protein
VEERSGVGAAVAYRFSHAFFRTTLYEETIAPRRIRLHQQVARALESVYGRRIEEHAAELAEHYSYSSSPEDLKKAVEYGELAAQRASQVFDYGEAERHLLQALKVQEVLDPDDKTRRLELLLALCEAMLPQDNPGRLVDAVAPEAFSLAEALGDSQRAARVAARACEAIRRSASLWAYLDNAIMTRLNEWAVRAGAHAQPGSPERISADAYMGAATITLISNSAGHIFLRRAVEQARDTEDNAVFFSAANFALTFLNAIRDQQLVDGLTSEVLEHSRVGARPIDLLLCLDLAGLKALEHGDRAAAEEAWRDVARLAEQARDSTGTVRVAGAEVCVAFLDGRLEDALDLIEALQSKSQEFGVMGMTTGSSTLATPLLLAAVLSLLGQNPEPVLTMLGTNRSSLAQQAVVLALLGRFSEVPAIRARFGDVGSNEDESATSILFALLLASVLTGDRETAGSLVPRFAAMAGELRSVCWMAVGRLLGDALVLLDKPDQARGFYAQAVEVCGRVRHRPELALTHLSLAELLLDHYPNEQDAAIEHLDFAIAELRDMKMQPALERALGRRGLLKA